MSSTTLGRAPRPAPPSAGPGAALDHALAAYPPALARRGEQSLQRTLVDRADGPWCGSRLTGDGFPVELSFTTTDASLRYTVDPDPGCGAPLAREVAAVRAGRELGVDLEGVVADMRQLRGQEPLRYGAWLGVRHAPDGDEVKAYLEVPATHPSGAVWSWLGSEPPDLGDRLVHLRMLGWTAPTGRREVYLRVPQALPHHLRALLAPIGASARAEELDALIRLLRDVPLPDGLPGPSVGVSYRALPGGPPDVATLYLHAHALWGPDGRIRRAFARHAEVLGWDPRTYLQVTEPLRDGRGWRTRHGAVAVALAASGPIALGIGVRPVEADA